MTERTLSMSAGLAASTVTPGITAPEVSRTTPAIFPVSAWAHAVAGNSRDPTNRSHANLTIVPPFQTHPERTHDAAAPITHSSPVLVKNNPRKSVSSSGPARIRAAFLHPLLLTGTSEVFMRIVSIALKSL